MGLALKKIILVTLLFLTACEVVPEPEPTVLPAATRKPVVATATEAPIVVQPSAVATGDVITEPAVTAAVTLSPPTIVATLPAPDNTSPTLPPPPTVPPTTIPPPTIPPTLLPTLTPSPPPTAIPTTPPTQTPNPTPTTPPPATRWQGAYYSNPVFAGEPTLMRTDVAINFSWATEVAPGLPADNFSVRWLRTVPLAAGTYRFSVVSDGGVRVWLDGLQLIDQWQNTAVLTYTADLALSTAPHTIQVEYTATTEPAQIHFWWDKLDAGVGWYGEYWANPNLVGPPDRVQEDTSINFVWDREAPFADFPADSFSARWTRIIAFTGGNYRFYAVADDGVRIFLDGTIILDAWAESSAQETWVEYAVTPGTHHIQVEYYDQTREASIRVWWEDDTLYPQWRGAYWTNAQLIGDPVLTRNDRYIDFNWGFEPPDALLPPDGFSARWTRRLTFSGGLYRIYATADDGVRIFVDGQPVIVEWHLSSGGETYSANMSLRGTHDITIEYFDNVSEAQIQVWLEPVAIPPD